MWKIWSTASTHFCFCDREAYTYLPERFTAKKQTLKAAVGTRLRLESPRSNCPCSQLRSAPTSLACAGVYRTGDRGCIFVFSSH